MTAPAPAQNALVPSPAGSTEPTLTKFEVIERVIAGGNLAQMSASDRVAFYWRVCESLGLNPLTRPFEFIVLNGAMTLYARKDATDQLRKINAVSVTNIRREVDNDLGLLTVYAAGRDKTGREDEATGVVSIKGLGGEALANATMKAETKAKRRLTLSLVGLGFLDESEVEGRGDVDVDPATGEITERPKPKSLLESVQEQQAALEAAATTSQESWLDETDAAADTDVVEGDAREVETAEAAPAPVDAFAAAIRASADASGLQGLMTEPQGKALAAAFHSLKKEHRAAVVKAGLEALWPDIDWTEPTAARANAVIQASSDAAFVDHWLALADVEGAA